MFPKSAFLAGTALAAFATVPAFANEAMAVDADAGAVEAGGEAFGEAQDSSGLVDIVVTATKRETNLQETPIAIAVMSDEDLQKRQASSLLDLGDGGIPSLRISTFESRQTALTIGMRGIVPDDANQPAREQGVGVYVDGVYLGRQHGLNAGFLDVERIEVLKGPQGTLFGRNTEGGAVNMVLRAPSGEFGGRVTAGLGNYGRYNGTLRLDLPEVAGFSIKLDASLQHQNATTQNPLAGQKGWNYFHRYGGRAAVRWKPSEDFTADFSIDSGHDESTAFLSQLINFNPTGRPVATVAQIQANGGRLPSGFVAPLPALVTVQPERAKTASVGVPQQPSIGKTFGVTSKLAWDITDDAEIRSITAWRTVSDRQFDNSGLANRTPVFAPNGSFSRYSIATLDQRQFSQELQVVGKAGDLDYVFGGYYFNERAEDSARTPNTNRWNADGTAYSIIDPATYPLSPVARASVAFAKSYAVYGQATYNLETLALTLGGRMTRDEKNGRLFTVNGAATSFTFRENDRRFDPLATIAWQASDSINLYAKYATGYRAGGASSRSLNYRSFGPEAVKSYEVGAKTEFFDRLVRLNLAGYIMDRTDTQVDFNFFIPQTNGTVRNTLETVNAAGTTKIRGIEADLTVRPADGLSLGMSYAFTHTKVPPARNTVQEQLNASLTPPVTTQVFQDVYILYTPKHALSGSIDYDIPVNANGAMLKLHVDGNYSSPAFTFASENVKTDKSFIVNARLSLAEIPMSENGQNMTVALWARNLLNNSIIYRRSNANRLVLGDYANFNAPRTVGMEVTVAF
ncbi:TonB-dependent receptor [Sphingorhabdus sp.]|jgi:iron complex outermembrane receptor protein|uniref:TonB-dependent receptor n=1 Tax=Sphingorhabdus sp. TaxID=1902408 RepID=UPI0037C60B53